MMETTKRLKVCQNGQSLRSLFFFVYNLPSKMYMGKYIHGFLKMAMLKIFIIVSSCD